jgi:uncharacterized protein YndB with AHSA1/START domain
MRKPIMIIAAVILGLIALVLVLAASRPDAFRVERSISINAAPEKVFGAINDFHRWTAWSPWEKIDPDMKRSYSGAAAGEGAAYAWEGNNKVGQGRMEIAQSSPSSRIVIKLDFLKPFEAHNTAEFTLVPKGGTTVLTWAMYGPQPFVTKVMTLFISMDKMVGKDFEKGLANLKAVAEQ